MFPLGNVPEKYTRFIVWVETLMSTLCKNLGINTISVLFDR